MKKKLSAEICCDNKIYIWVEGEGLFDRNLELVDYCTTKRIYQFAKIHGVILSKYKFESVEYGGTHHDLY